VARDRGDVTLAETLSEECLVLARELGDCMRIAAAVNWRGLLAADRGDAARAARLVGEA
jgi:hypothetical protein